MSDITKIKVDGEPESSYQLYPRNEEFEKRGAQPDWNQNDETAADYVKNRPFYTGDSTENVLFNGSFVFTIIGMGPMGERGVYNSVIDFSPEIGQTYQVSWDGAVYSCVGTEYNSSIALGNLSIMNFGSDTGEPFLMTCGTGSINIYTSPVGSSHTISIGKTVVPVVKIDPKYLVQPDWNQNDSTAADFVKNRPFYTGDPVETVLVEESTAPFTEDNGLYSVQIPPTFEATVGETYKVYWDGAAYECTCVNLNEDNIPVIGNLSIIGAGSDTGEPFVMIVINGQEITILTADTSASHTISISGFVQEVVKINAKYIPALDYLDKNNPTGTGAFSMNRKVNSDIGQYSVALGENCVASGKSSISVGHSTEATELTAQAFGWYTQANARFSHAEGYYSKVSTNASEKVATYEVESGAGIYGHAEGVGTLVTGGIGAHAEGAGTLASGSSSHAEGYKTIASGENQHVQGKYNIEDSSGAYAHIVGNGTMPSQRSNAHTLDWSGNAWYAGTVEGKALILPSSTSGSTKKFRITVDDSGTLTATEVT